jgi:enoyl-CoA hydratase/carnithine racemase
VASSIAAQVLRIGENLGFGEALMLESLAYSALLGGAEFRRWRTETPRGEPPAEPGAPVRLERRGDTLSILLTRPHRRNALSAAMRDGLCGALGLAALDPSIRRVELAGEGPNFCAGGDFAEFGSNGDLAAAHILRVAASAAMAAHGVAGRLHVVAHGATVGGGLEIAAAAGDFSVRPDARLWLPEVSMGLIPGAGGTVTVPRRVGRQRALYMMLTQARIEPATALEWGLVDGVIA